MSCFATVVQNVKFLNPHNVTLTCLRNASKKASSSTRNSGNRAKPKHRGWRVQDGHVVTPGTILVKQNHTRFHPGLNVGFGKDGTLFAMEAGKVIVSCEQVNPNWSHTWIQRHYEGREGQKFYKKHFNVIPEPQHDRFIIIDRI